MSNIHTISHDYAANGRSIEIEGYIAKSVAWCIANIGVPTSVLDVGADYGHALHLFRTEGTERVKGLELYGESGNPHNLEIARENIEDPLLFNKLGGEHFDLVFVNHVLEHLTNPYFFMGTMRQLKPKFIYIGVPECRDDWAYWDCHYTIWNERFLTHFMKLNNFELVASNVTALRPGKTELWGLYKPTGV